MNDLTRRLLDRCIPEPNSGCWLWLLATDQDGYGLMKFRGKSVRAHRAAYIAFAGPLPASLVIDHRCRNRLCINPDHLEAVPDRVNLLRGDGAPARNARKSHCKRGHLLSGSNLRITGGRRICRACAKGRYIPAPPRQAAEACQHGHPWNVENTYWHNGHRYCRECNRLSRKKVRNDPLR